MNFDVSDEGQAIGDVATEVLGSEPAGGAMPESTSGAEWLDAQAYQGLASVGVLGALLPESVGGAGLGLIDVLPAFEAVGRSAAQVPLWESVILGAVPVMRHGSADLQSDLLPGVVDGSTLLTGAFIESGSDLSVVRTEAHRQGSSWRITGAKTQVPIADIAERILVSAMTSDGPRVFLISPASAGVSITQQSTVTSRPLFRLDLADVSVGEADVLGDSRQDGSDVLTDIIRHARVGLAGMASGVAWGALRLAASYTSQRHQFGRPISSFQAVGQRLADAYVDADAISMTALQAAWALTTGQDASGQGVDDCIDTASWWASEGGHRVAHAAHHVHGGMGVDLDYPMHRYFRLAKYIEFTFGSATRQLARVGARFA